MSDSTSNPFQDDANDAPQRGDFDALGPSPKAFDPQHPLNVSRTLLFGWCAWLLASWAMNLMIDAPRWTGSYANMLPGDLYIPAVRGMMQSMLLGLTIAWPAWRLSERVPRGAAVGIQVAIDLTSMLLIAQVVLWPLQYVVNWAFEQTALIMMTMLIWSLPIGLAVWIGRRIGTPRARVIAMAVCLLALVAGWGWMIVAGSHTAVLWSPTAMLWQLSGRVSIDVVALITQRLIAMAVITTVAWAVLRLTIGRGAYNA